jgi:phage shock protein PspC (stress-responsive transcriptional regulator)
MSDETSPDSKPPPEGRPRNLKRSSGDRLLAGVAGGLGAYFGIDPLLFRIALVLSIFFGGFGLFAYLLLAIFVPVDGPPDPAQKLGYRLRSLGLWRVVGLAAAAILAAGFLLGLAGAAAFAVALGWGAPFAVFIVAAAAGLVLAAFRGSSRWLIAPVLALAIGASVAAAAGLDFRGGIGERTYQPLSTRAIPSGGYQLGVGHLVVDLRRLDWARQPVVHVNVHLGVGQAQILVPPRVCVITTSHTGVGESEVTGQLSRGLDLTSSVGTGSSALPRLVLGAHLDIGQLQVINAEMANVESPDDAGLGPFDQISGTLRAAETTACARS